MNELCESESETNLVALLLGNVDRSFKELIIIMDNLVFIAERSNSSVIDNCITSQQVSFF